MGRKRKSIIELTQPSFRVKKSKLNAKNLKKSCPAQNVENTTNVKNFNIENGLTLENSNQSNVDLNVDQSNLKVYDDNVEESFHDSLNGSFEHDGESSKSNRNTSSFVGSVLRKHSIKFNLGRTCVSSMLKDLKSHFYDLPSDYRTLLKTPRSTDVRFVKPGHYVHLGILRNIKNHLGNCDEQIAIDIFIDGFNVYRDTILNSYWIILGRLGKKIFPIGIYNGEKIPEDFNDFLLDFCIESKDLIVNGIIIGHDVKTFAINNVLLDSPAKSHVTYTKYHTGYGSCFYCYIEGFHDGSRVCFLETDCKLRTNSDFENQLDQKFHKGISIFQSALQLKMIDQIPIDYLHCVLLGIVKKMLTKLFIDERPLLTSFRKDKVSKALLFSNIFLCTEIHRKFRDLKHLKSFHGNELRVFLLKIGIVVLKDVVPNEIYNNFLLLHIAITILCDPILCLSKNSFADFCLKLFIKDAIEIYGTGIATSVLHDLQHLPKMVLKYQSPLDSFSTFPFENYLLSLKDMVHSNNKPLAQIHRRLEEKLSLEESDENETHEFQKNEFRFISSKYKINSVYLKNFKISVSGCRDRFVMCKNFNIYVCLEILKNPNGEPVLKAKKLKSGGNFYDLPVNSTKLDIYECVTSYEGSFIYIKHTDVYRKMLGVPYSSRTMAKYSLVKTTELSENSIFIVPEDWVYDDDAQLYCFYPKSISNVTKYIKEAVDPNNTDFIVYKIDLVKENIDTYELALIAKKRRKDFNDTESEIEYNKNQKVNRRETKKRKISDDFVYDLNDRFDKFEVPKGRKIKTEPAEKPTVVSQHPKKIQAKINDAKSSNTAKSNKKSELTQKNFRKLETSFLIEPSTSQGGFSTQNQSQLITHPQYLNKQNETIRIESIEEIKNFVNSQVTEIQKSNDYNDQMISSQVVTENTYHTCKCDEYYEKLNEKLNLILDAVRAVGMNQPIPQAYESVETKSYSPLDDEKKYQDLESDLLIYYNNPKRSSSEFKIKRNEMIRYFSKKLNSNNKGAAKNGLMSSLFNLYFHTDFISSLGWSNFQGRIQLKNQNGHLSLFFDIINKCAPGTYNSVQDAGTAVKIFLRRYHEKHGKAKRQMSHDE